MIGRRSAVLLAAGAVALGSVVIVGSASADPVAVECSSDGVTLTCPLPAPSTVTVTQTATVTQQNTVTATVTGTASTSVAPTTTSAATTTSQPPVTTPATTTAAPVTGFPTATTAGVPANWAPTQTLSSLNVTTAGAVVQDVRVNGNVTISAKNVTLRRVDIVGGRVENWPGASCNNGLLLDTVTIRRATGQVTKDNDPPAVGSGGYTARNVKVEGYPEGLRSGGKSGGCTATTIENSWVHVTSPDTCGDWHGDGLQGYDGPAVTVRNSVLWLDERSNCGGTAPFFYPVNQGNTSATVDGLIVRGGGYSFRLGMPSTVKNLHIVDNSWGYGPIDVKCSAVSSWQASISTLNAAGQPVVVRSQPCNTNGGS